MSTVDVQQFPYQGNFRPWGIISKESQLADQLAVYNILFLRPLDATLFLCNVTTECASIKDFQQTQESSGRKETLTLICSTELLWFVCWLNHCQVTSVSVGWPVQHCSCCFYAKLFHRDVIDCGISTQVSSPVHCFYLSRISWQARQLRTLDLSLKHH